MIKSAGDPGPSPRKLWLGNELVVFVDEPEQVQKVLSSKYCLDKPAFYKGMMAENGEKIYHSCKKKLIRLCSPNIGKTKVRNQTL